MLILSFVSFWRENTSGLTTKYEGRNHVSSKYFLEIQFDLGKRHGDVTHQVVTYQRYQPEIVWILSQTDDWLFNSYFIWLVVWKCLEHGFYDFPSYCECHHPNWRTPSFFRGVGWNHQPVIIFDDWFTMLSDLHQNSCWQIYSNRQIDTKGQHRENLQRKRHLSYIYMCIYMYYIMYVCMYIWYIYIYIYHILYNILYTYIHYIILYIVLYIIILYYIILYNILEQICRHLFVGIAMLSYNRSWQHCFGCFGWGHWTLARGVASARTAAMLQPINFHLSFFSEG